MEAYVHLGALVLLPAFGGLFTGSLVLHTIYLMGALRNPLHTIFLNRRGSAVLLPLLHIEQVEDLFIIER